MSDKVYDLSDLKVLVVDDNQNMRLLVRSILSAFGIKKVEDADNAETAYLKFSRFSSDLVITDLHMEPQSGLDLVRRIRTAEDSPNPYVPIIMLSGYSEAARVAEARDAGATEFLSKPISAQSIYRRIQSVVENPRSFVRADNYFGPDRRRHDVGPPEGHGERRIADAVEEIEDASDDPGMV